MTSNNATLLNCLDEHAVNKPDDTFLVDRKDGAETCYSFQQVQATVETIARSLASLFPGSGHNISILSGNCAHWTICDLGVLRSGNVLAPVFTTMPPATFRYAMEFTDIKLLFVGEAGNWDKVKGEIPSQVKIVSLPGVTLAEADYSFEEFLVLGVDTPLPEHPDPDAPCTIVFTSGTTGMPKGVMHSLKTLQAAVSAVSNATGPQERFFSYLPLAHLGDRGVAVFHGLLAGGRVTYNSSLETFSDDLKAAAPTYMMGVPRIWEKLLQGILASTGIDAEELKSRLEQPGGEELARELQTGLGLQNIRHITAGTAPTSKAIKQWYVRLGMPLSDIYAQTEIFPFTCAIGDTTGEAGVGPVLPGYECKITDEGEIVGRGPSMALGYYNNPEKTAAAFVDGWVHTGDKGRVDKRGNIHITGRVQDTFKTSKGKYVAPVPIENGFSRSVLVEQQCLYGHGLTQPIMLCTLAETAQGSDEELGQKLSAFTEELNKELEPHERIGGLIICKSPWTVEAGILTHTLKVKRDCVAEAFTAEIESIAQTISDNTGSTTISWI